MADFRHRNIFYFRDGVHKTFHSGTHRNGGLMQISVVGTKQEEVGGYFPEFNDMMERNPFLKAVMPWGDRSLVHGMPRSKSNDGPIVWARPGEQMVPTADMPKSPFKQRRR